MVPAPAVDLPAPVGFEPLDRAFDRSMRSLLENAGRLTVLFSGGVDSSLLAYSLRHHPGLHLVTVGVEGSVDLANGRSASELLRLPWRGAIVGPTEMVEVLTSSDDLLEGASGSARSVAVSLGLAVRATEPSTVVTAQGVDELFLGYAHFRGLAGSALQKRYHEDLSGLLEREWPRARRIAQRMGRVLVAPFLEPELLPLCEAIPLEIRAQRPGSKPWFRSWAQHRGLPTELVERPKKALQFGSGIDRMLRSRSPR